MSRTRETPPEGGLPAAVVLDARARLGEGPRWLAERGRLLWLDIYGRCLHLTEPVAGTDTTWPLAEEVGAAAPRNSEEAVLAAPSGLLALNYASGETTRLLDFSLAPDARFNDGLCDPAGRFWAGTLAADYRPSAGRLLRIAPDGRVTTQLDGIRLTNGIGLSPDCGRLYFIDSLLQRVDAFDFDLDRGRLGTRRTVARIDPAEGIPDGLAVDREGGIWVAIFGAGRVRRFTPDGEPDLDIVLPAANVTACTFGGPDLATMYVTTAVWSPTGDADTPGAGGLFAVRPGVAGMPAHRFAG
jgi:sugar lactone lactonase YvrE